MTVRLLHQATCPFNSVPGHQCYISCSCSTAKVLQVLTALVCTAAEELDLEPGAEFRAARQAADAVEAQVSSAWGRLPLMYIAACPGAGCCCCQGAQHVCMAAAG